MPIRPFGINPGEINWAAKGARKGAFDSNALPWLSRPSGGLVLFFATSIVLNGGLPFFTSSWLGFNTYLVNQAQRAHDKRLEFEGKTVEPFPEFPSPVERYPQGWEKTVDIGEHWNALRTNPMKHGTLPQ